MLGHNGNDGGDGWFRVHRSVFDHEVVGIRDRDYTEFEAWLWLFGHAAYRERRVVNKGSIVILDPGQIMAAHGYLATKWRWQVGRVRWFLKRLEQQAMIARYCDKQTAGKRNNQIQIITICNYAIYQSGELPKQQAPQQPEQQANDKPTTSEQQANDNKIRSKEINNNTKLLTRESVNAVDLDELQDRLLSACNGALDNPANCMGLLNLSIPQMWLREGADLDLDVIPALKAAGQKYHGKRIRDWSYFTPIVSEAKAKRQAGLPAVTIDNRQAKSKESSIERTMRIAAKIAENGGV